MITLQPTLKPFKWNLNPKQPKTILKIKNQKYPIQPQRPSSSSGEIKRANAFPTHVDENFTKTLTRRLYKKRLSPDYEVLDLMCSSVSHLPKEVTYKKVVGHGLDAEELDKNPRLDDFVVKDLNQAQIFEFENASFDAVLCTASVQYLQEPEKVFAEVLRLLRPDGVFIVSFNTRLLYEKAIDAWKNETKHGRVQLVVKYFKCVEGFTKPEIVTKQGDGRFIRVFKLLINMFNSKSDPFCAVIAYKKPIYK